MADDDAPRERSGLTRKQALAGGGAVVLLGAGAAAIVISASDDDDDAAGYPRRRVAQANSLKPNQPVNFEYPATGQRSVLLDLGEEVPGGVGDNKSIVAYSSLCQHMGCPVGYEPGKKHFVCGCHQTRYDPAREGGVIQGVSQRPLPRIALEVDGDEIFATGVSGLIYGFRDNLASTAKTG